MAQLNAHLQKNFSLVNALGYKQPIIGASVFVFKPKTSVQIAETLYADDSSLTPLTQPLITDANGQINCYTVDTGSVDLVLSGTNIVTTTFRANFEPYNSNS